MFNIKEELKKLPDKPGVYIMKDKNDNILYVGKAIVLKNRVRQYFRKSNKTARIEKMVSLVDHFEYIVTDNEAEALILECNLIKKNMPKFNVLLKDDKTYPYIKIDVKSDFPNIFITRRYQNDGGKYKVFDSIQMYPAFIRKEKVNNMAAIKNKHLSFENRCIIQEFLDYSYSFTAIAKRIGKDRTTIAKEVKTHRFLIGVAAKECEFTSKPPYVCNGCDKKLYCKKTKYRYEASIAHNEYNKTLRETRAVIKATKQEIAAINDVISPLMINKHHSVNQV